MGQALYRKYRSKSFKDVVGQDHITSTLRNAIKSGRISHAYLFTGPRGVGKTSVARILAHEVNSLNYNDESVNLDIIEIDAASNRRIDEIRDLRDKVRIAPTSSKYKVYIIDEVHMLTREAFNALLKTLEEPPAHCIFILATTEAHKLPETIISRTQRFEFKPVDKHRMAKHLRYIAKQERLDVATDALEVLAEFGNGSFRDSISYLDQLSSLGKQITIEDVRDLLGLPPASDIDKLLGLISTGDSAGLLKTLDQLAQKGVSPAAIAASLSANLRKLALSNGIETWHVRLLRELLGVSSGSRAQEALEITLLNFASSFSQNTRLDVQPSKTSKPATKATNKVADAAHQPAKAAAVELNKESQSQIISEFSLELWDEVVKRSKNQAASIYTALRLATPSYQDGVITLTFQFPLHQKKLDQASNKHLVSGLVEDVFGKHLNIETSVKRHKPTPTVDTKDEQLLAANPINAIFGNTEMLET